MTYVMENDRWWLDLMTSRKTEREPGFTSVLAYSSSR